MLLFFGDLHGNFRHLERAVAEHSPAAIILLGDIEAPQPLEQVLAKVLKQTEVWFIPGNHDSDRPELWANLTDSHLASHNLHGKVVKIDGVRVAGLGGVFREEIWWPDPVTVSPNFENYVDYQQHVVHASSREMADIKMANRLMKHRSSIFAAEYDALAAQEADVLVTHEAPSCHRYGFKAIDELARAMRIKTSFHGHHHDSLDYRPQWQALGFNAYGIGLRGITNLHGVSLRARELDAQREATQFCHKQL